MIYLLVDQIGESPPYHQALSAHDSEEAAWKAVRRNWNYDTDTLSVVEVDGRKLADAARPRGRVRARR